MTMGNTPSPKWVTGKDGEQGHSHFHHLPFLVCISDSVLSGREDSGAHPGPLQGQSKAALCGALLRPHHGWAFSPPLLCSPYWFPLGESP